MLLQNKTFFEESGFLQFFLRMLSPSWLSPAFSGARSVSSAFSGAFSEGFLRLSPALASEKVGPIVLVRGVAQNTFSELSPFAFSHFLRLSPGWLSPAFSGARSAASDCFLRLSPGYFLQTFSRFFLDGLFLK